MSDSDEDDERRRIAWDPFDNVDNGDDPSPEELRRRHEAIIAHATSLDPRIIVCTTCGVTTDAWIIRSGRDGSGFCRVCIAARANNHMFAKEIVRTFYEGLAALLQLRAERDTKIAEELAEVPF